METKVKRLSHPKKKEVAPEGSLGNKLAGSVFASLLLTIFSSLILEHQSVFQ